MYGFIHCALEDLVIQRFGEETWQKILKKTGIKLRGGSFLIHKVYSDDITNKLIKATADITGMDRDQCLEAFGQNFLHYCQKNGFDQLLRVLGRDLPDFLTNLDSLHDHLGSIYPGMRAPSFRVSQGHEGTLLLHYYSERRGLHSIVRGLVEAVAREFFNIEVSMNIVQRSECKQKHHVLFEIHQPPATGASSNKSSNALCLTKPSSSIRDLPIDARTFCSAFPFHLIFDRTFRITQAGKGILRLTKDYWRHKRKVRFTDLFIIVRPVIDVTFDSIHRSCHMVFVVVTKSGVLNIKSSSPVPSKPLKDDSNVGVEHDSLRLKGQMLHVPEADSIMFLCSPRVSSLDEMAAVGLYMSDFPVHDQARDLVMLGHYRKGERELVHKLDEASNHLKVLDAKLREDKKNTEELLYSILPLHVARRLCQNEAVEAESFPMSTVLVSDIVGFTAMCGKESVQPMDIVRMLNSLYMRFDTMTATRDVSKVETIGDAYVVAGGVPEFVSDHADRVISIGLDMIWISHMVFSPVDGLPIQLRVGIHSGPVIAGVVGLKMPRYCLFGNTVTLAIQLESRSHPGRVHISDDTRRQLTQRGYFFEDSPVPDLSMKCYFVTKPDCEDKREKLCLTVSPGDGLFRSPTSSPAPSDHESGGIASEIPSPLSPGHSYKGADGKKMVVPLIFLPGDSKSSNGYQDSDE